MKNFILDLITVPFGDIFGTKALDTSINKFRDLRDSYRATNREYFGDYLFSILDKK